MVPSESGIGNFESARFLQFQIRNLKFQIRGTQVTLIGFEILNFGLEIQESCTFEISDSPSSRVSCLTHGTNGIGATGMWSSPMISSGA